MSRPSSRPLDEAADRLMDVWLEEVVGGCAPPDLTEQIIAAGLQSESATETDASSAPAIRPIASSPRSERRSRALFITVAAALLLMAGGAYFAFHRSDSPGDSASSHPAPTHSQPAPAADRSTGSHRHSRIRPSEPDGEGVPETPPWEKPSSPHLAREPATKPNAPPQPRSVETIVSTIDDLLTQSWQVAHLTPSPEAEASIWCRRVYVGILGRIPSVTELEDFLDQRPGERRAALVDRLLSSEFAEERADYWSTVWTNVFVGRSGGDERGREALTRYLRTAIVERRPFDRIVYELMGAVGTTEANGGAGGFWMVHDSADAVRIADWATRVFWAQPLGCVRCHDQFDGPSKQDDFWSLNVVLRTARAQRGEPTRLVIRNGDSLPEVFFERPDGRLAMAVPRLPDGSLLEDELSHDLAALRETVARQFAESPHVARALANRLWAHFLGFGFTRPVDDMAPPRQVSHPELLEFLAEQLRAHDYDWQAMMRWIVLSDPFSRSSRITEGNERDVPETGVSPQFTRYYARPLAPEAVFQSLSLVASPSSQSKEMVAARRQWLGHWTESMGTDDGSEHSLFQQGVQKSWSLMNDPLMQRATNSREKGFLRSVAESSLPADQKISHLFLAALARRPSPKEQTLAQSLLEQHQDDPARALEDIWWALLNSQEFLSDH